MFTVEEEFLLGTDPKSTSKPTVDFILQQGLNILTYNLYSFDTLTSNSFCEDLGCASGDVIMGYDYTNHKWQMHEYGEYGFPLKKGKGYIIYHK